MEINEKTQEEFLKMMLDNLANTEDKTPNSFSYDALSSAAIVFRYFQEIILELFKKFDVTNLEGEELDTRALQIAGLTRKEPTYATGLVRINGEEGTFIPKGTVFLADEKEYRSIDDYTVSNLGYVDVRVKAGILGSDGNVSIGEINKLKHQIPGVSKVTNEDDLHNGYDLEQDGDLIERYLYTLANPPKAGNPSHYKLWATEVDGVWDAKVFRTWKGPSTVRVVVVGLDRKKLDDYMIEKIKNHIMEEAPITYADLTVESAKTKPVNIKVSVYSKSANKEQLQRDITDVVDKYLYSISFRESYVSMAKVGKLILSLDNVLDYKDLALNGKTGNIKLADDEIPDFTNVEVSLIE